MEPFCRKTRSPSFTAIVSLVGAAWLRMGLPQFAVIGAALMALSVLALIPTRVTLGSDGLLLRWLGREQFVKLSDIEDVGEWRGFVRLRLRGRREAFDIPVAMWRVHSPLVAFDVAILAGRIREAIRAQHKGPPFDTTLLERSSRAVPDWLASLRQLTTQTGAYRAALHAEDLWHVLEDPSALPSARGAAAVVLGRSLDERGRAKLRVLSESSAVPKLRVALQAVARDDDAALTAALAAMEDETSAQRGAAS